MNGTTATAMGAAVVVLGGIGWVLLPVRPEMAEPGSSLPPRAESSLPIPAMHPASVPPRPPSAARPVPPPPAPDAPAGEGPRRSKEAGTITGRVLLEPARTPVPGVEIRFSTPEIVKPQVTVTVVSGLDGTFRVTGIPPGRVFIASEGNEYASEYGGSTVLNTGTGFDGYDMLLLPIGCIEGRVTGARGEPLALLAVKAEDIHSRLSFSALTDLDGTYRFLRLPAATYSVSTANALLGIRRGRVEVTAGGHGRVDFPGGASLVGTVIWDDRTPWANAEVDVERSTPGAPPVLQCRSRTDGKGEFRVECLEPGPCEVRVGGPGGSLSPGIPIEVRTGENRITIDLGRGVLRGAVAGKVRMPGGAAPGDAAMCTVTLTATSANAGPGAWGRSSPSTDGSFRVVGVPGGAYRLTVSCAGSEFQVWERDVTIATGERREGIQVDMVRVPVGRVRFTAKTGSGTQVEAPMVSLALEDNRAHFKVEKREPGTCTVSASAGSRTFRVWADGAGSVLKVLDVKEGADLDVEVVLTPEKTPR